MVPRFFDVLIRPRPLFLLLLLVTLLKGWLWSVVVPVWQANDEEQHYTYAQEIVRERSWAVSPPSQVPEEQSLLWNLVSPFRLSLQREPMDLSPAGLAQIDTVLRRLKSPAAHTTLVPWNALPHFMGQHPPLYYTLEAAVYRLGKERSILVRMAWMRFLSVLIALGTVTCTYGAARTVWPDRAWFPLAAATLVSFHPYFTFFTSVINNAALEMLCFAGLAWVAAAIARQGMNWRRGLALGGVLTAGLLTKSSFLAAIPLVVLLWGWELLRTRGRCHWGGWTLAATLPLVLAGWWYTDYVASGGEMMADLYSQSPRAPQAVPFLRFLRTYPWLGRYIALLREWWGAFGWRDTPYPATVYVGLELLTFAALLGWVWWGARSWWRREPAAGPAGTRGDGLALIIGTVCTLSLIAFFTVLDYRMATYGGRFKIQGRYFLAPIAAQMMALAVGWDQLSRRWGLAILCTAMIGLNTYALFGVVVPRYYGEEIVVRHEPVGAYPLTLARDVVTRRDFTVEGEGLSRVDVWPKQVEGAAVDEVTFTLYREGQPIVNILISPQQMIPPFPAIIRFRAPEGGSPRYTAELRGTGAQVDQAQDGQMALKAYRRVPLGQIPERISLVQPAGRSMSFLWILSGYCLLCLGLYVTACWALAARLVRPIPLPLDLEAP